MTPEYFVVSFINDITMYYNLFQYNLEPEICNFIMKDVLLIINNIFIEAVNNIIPVWCNGSTSDSGSDSQGSNPWTGAIYVDISLIGKAAVC